jgi:histone demethylase JARID1
LKRYDFKALSTPLSVEKHPMNENLPPEDLSIPNGPVFYATQQDFEHSPVEFINKIRPIAQKYGICKIVPPKDWNPPFGMFVVVDYSRLRV